MGESEVVLLDNKHKKAEFECGKDLLDNYIRKQVSQDFKRGLAICFVIVDEGNVVKGYYTLSSYSILQAEIPEEFSKRLPNSYTNIPVTLLGRLAVDKSHRGKGHGEFLLIDALNRALSISKSSVASMAVVVDPIDEEAVKFYEKYGFIFLPDSGKMFLPMSTIEKAFG